MTTEITVHKCCSMYFLYIFTFYYFFIYKFTKITYIFIYLPFIITRDSLVVQLVKHLPAMPAPPVRFLGREDPLEKGILPTPVSLGFPCGSAAKESTCNVGDLDSIPGLGRFPGEMNGYPLQYSGLENSRDCIVNGVTKSRTQLSDFHFHFTFYYRQC